MWECETLERSTRGRLLGTANAPLPPFGRAVDAMGTVGYLGAGA
jgi:hypothetical protein